MKAFSKDIVRTIRGSMKRFVSLVVITALGATMLTGLSMACIDLRAAAEALYARQRLFDISVQGTLGLTNADIAELAQVDGVAEAEGAYQEDAYTHVEGKRATVTVKALLDSGMNEPYVEEGRLPQAADEVAVTAYYLKMSGKKLGDTLTFESADAAENGTNSEQDAEEKNPATGTGEDTGTAGDPAASSVAGGGAAEGDGETAGQDSEAAGEGTGENAETSTEDADESAATESEPVFSEGTYTIVGTIIDPANITQPDGPVAFRAATSSDYTFFVTADAVANPDVFTAAYLRVEGTEGLAAYSDAYEARVDEVQARVEDLAPQRERARTQEVKNDALKTIADEEADAREQFAEAEQQLADAQNTLDESLQEALDGQRELNLQRADALAQLDAAQATINAGAAALAAGRTELVRQEASANQQLAAAQAEIDNGRAQMAAGMLEINAREQEAAAGQAQIADGYAQLEAGQRELDTQRAAAEAGRDQVAAGIAQADAGAQALIAQLGSDEVAAAWDSVKAATDESSSAAAQTTFVNAVENDVNGKLEQIDTGLAQLKDGISQAESQLEALNAQAAPLEQQAAQVNGRLNEIANRTDQIDARAGAITSRMQHIDERTQAIDARVAQIDAALAQGSSAQTDAAGGGSAQAGTGSTAESASSADDLRAERAALLAERDQLAGERTDLAAEQETLAQERAALTQKQATLEPQQQQLTQALAPIEAARAQIDALLNNQDPAAGNLGLYVQQATLQAQRDQLAALIAPGENGASQVAQLAAGMGQATVGLAQAQAGLAQIETAQRTIDQNRSALNAAQEELNQGLAQLASARATLQAGAAQLDAGQAQLAAGTAQARALIAQGWDELEAGADELATGQAELNAQRASALAQLADAQRQIDEGLQQIADGQAELNENRDTFLQERADAEQQIADARAEVDEIEPATWYVQDRSSLGSYASVDSDASSIEAIAAIIPVIFFVVAVLVSLTTATRMVEEERTLIGLYKALGYAKGRILSKYLVYTVSATLIGCEIGDLMGFIAIPHVLLYIFSAMYLLPLFSLQFNALYAVGAVVLFVLGIGGATLITCRADLRETPAALMRPKAPRAGSRIFLERITPLWSRMGFLNKVTARNLFRYKKRFFMTIFGIMGCTALLICGFAIKNTVESLAPRQYEQVYGYDLLAVTSAENYEAGLERLRGSSEVTDIEPLGVDNVTVEYGGAKESMQVYVIPRGLSLAGYINLTTMDGAPINLDEEDVVVTNNAATVLGFDAGATVKLTDSALASAEVQVNAVTLNYLGNAVYMTQDAYEQAFGPLEVNALLAHLAGDNDQQAAFADKLEDEDLFLSLTSVAKMHEQFEKSFTLINVVVYVVIGLAAGLAFVVLFTLSTVNIGEREREIATIKVLGFRKGEVRTYINKETLVLTGLGILVGLPAGWALSESFTYILKMPSIFFDVVVDPWCYAVAAALTVVFALAVSLITNRMLDRIIMVEALKSPE